jgi:hypothetical protein
MKTTFAWMGVLATLSALAIGCTEAPAGEGYGDSASAQTSGDDALGALDAQTAARGRSRAFDLLEADIEKATMTIASSDNEIDEWRYDVNEKGFRLTARMHDSSREPKRIAYAMETKDGKTQLIGIAVSENAGNAAYLDALMKTAREDLAAAMKNIPEIEDPTSGQGLEDAPHRCSDHTLKVLHGIVATGLAVDAVGGLAVWTGVGTVAGGIALVIATPIVFLTGQAVDWCAGPKEVRVF